MLRSRLRKLVCVILLTTPSISFAESDDGRPALNSTSTIHRPLIESLTSFGAAVVGEYLYVFSGHSGDAHGFGKDLLVDHFRRIRFDDPTAHWEELAMHESAQSVALVTDGKDIYRVGGLTFVNEEGEQEALFQSTDDFTRYDIESNTWTELAPLPQPRSSLDVAIVGRTLYAVGGWDLQGKDAAENAPWHDTMHAFDLDNPDDGWKTLAGPGYKLRAISVAAHDGKLYALGGISPNGFLRKTSVFDPESKQWVAGPEMIEDSPMTGFATSTFAVGGHLYSTGASGIVYRLSDDGQEWQVADRLLFPRIFLRLLPVGDDRLIALGGTGMSAGRTAVVESLKVDPLSSVSEKIIAWTVPYEGQAKHSQTLILDGTNLFAFGGNASWQAHDFSQEAFSKEAFLFDVANQSVERLPDVPFPVQAGAGIVNQQTSEHVSIIVAGGMNFGDTKYHSIDSVLEFDPAAKRWTQPDVELPAARAMSLAVTHNDAIWIFGGSDAGAGDGDGLRDDVLHWWGDQTKLAALPEVKLPHPRRSFGGVCVGDECFLIGGLGEGMTIEPTVDVFHFNDRTWRTAASPATSRVFPSVAVEGSKIFLFGGFSGENGQFEECSSLEVYHSQTNTWETLAESIDGVDASMRLFNMSGRLLFFGIDRESEHQAKFVLYDPDPMAAPQLHEQMSSSFGVEGGSAAEKNAKILMRKDTDKDGKLSIEELGKRMTNFSKAADTDGDSLVSYDEAKAKMVADEQEAKTAEEGQAETSNSSATK